MPASSPRSVTDICFSPWFRKPPMPRRSRFVRVPRSLWFASFFAPFLRRSCCCRTCFSLDLLALCLSSLLCLRFRCLVDALPAAVGVHTTPCLPSISVLQKKQAESINSRLALVMKSGTYMLGYKSTLKSLRKGASKLVIISNNCPPLRKSEIEYYAMLAKTGVHHYSGSTLTNRMVLFLPRMFTSARGLPHVFLLVLPVDSCAASYIFLRLIRICASSCVGSLQTTSSSALLAASTFACRRSASPTLVTRISSRPCPRSKSRLCLWLYMQVAE